MENIEFYGQLTNTLWGSYGFQAFFYYSLFLILILEKEKFRQSVTSWYSICILLMIYNPLMFLTCQYIFKGRDITAYYCRLFCLIPIVYIIAYAAVLVLKNFSGWKKFAYTLFIIFIIAMNGHSVYGEEWFTKASNYNKVPDDVLQICALFQESKERISIMVPTELTVYMRQIDSNFSMPYGRYQSTDISNQLQNEIQDVEAILNYSAKTKTDYIVTLYTEEILAQYRNWGCETIGSTDKYLVLKTKLP